VSTAPGKVILLTSGVRFLPPTRLAPSGVLAAQPDAPGIAAVRPGRRPLGDVWLLTCTCARGMSA